MGKHAALIYVSYSRAQERELGIFHKLLGSVLTPVGEYGEDFATDLVRTTQIMVERARTITNEDSANTFNQNKKLMIEKTSRGKAVAAGSEKAKFELIPQSALVEGIVSLHQLINLVLSEKIAGVDSGPAALRLLVKSGQNRLGLLSEITMRLPMSVSGPATNAGFYFRHPLELNADGSLVPTHEFRDYLRDLQGQFEEKFGRKKSVCPMAMFHRGNSDSTQLQAGNEHTSGIQLLAESYLKVFEQIHSRDDASRSSEEINTSIPKQSDPAQNPVHSEVAPVSTWASIRSFFTR